MKSCKPELSFFIFTSYARSECFISEWNEDASYCGVKRNNASSEKAFLWSTPDGVWSILRHCRKIWSTADAVWSKAFSGFMFFALISRQKNGGERFFRTPSVWNPVLTSKNSEFSSEIKFKNRFNFHILSQNGSPLVDSNISHLYSNFKRKSRNRGNVLKGDVYPVLHDQNFLRNGDVPHPAGHGHIRASGLPLVRDKVTVGSDPGRRWRLKCGSSIFSGEDTNPRLLKQHHRTKHYPQDFSKKTKIFDF